MPGEREIPGNGMTIALIYESSDRLGVTSDTGPAIDSGKGLLH
jgi:hypothetical protein